MDQTRFAIITGASSGIGSACATALAREGKNLILVARRQAKLEEIKKKLEQDYNVQVLVYAVDLSKMAELEEFFTQIQGRNVDILVNNAGLALGKSSFEDYNWNDFNQMIDVNIRTFTRVAQLAIPFLKASQGHIVNISSIAGVEAYEGGSVYCGSKAFVRMLSKAIRIDLLGTKVRVTDVAPGAVETEFSQVRFKGDTSVADSVYEGYTPLYAEDVAETIVFALLRPKHVNLDYIAIMPTAQAGATRFARASA